MWNNLDMSLRCIKWKEWGEWTIYVMCYYFCMDIFQGMYIQAYINISRRIEKYINAGFLWDMGVWGTKYI